MILITGASGMLGTYVAQQFADSNIATLGRGSGNTYPCNLTLQSPSFGNDRFEGVVHCAGTENEREANALNLDGTRRLLEALDANPPEWLVYVSSFRVYSGDAGEGVDERHLCMPDSVAGQSKLKAEQEVEEWARRHGVTLTIVRPARMFGSNVGGEMLTLFNDALNGGYIHIRGNGARLSLVTALDVAKAIKGVYKKGGIYNAADGNNPKWVELAEAMTANAGRAKRMVHLPPLMAEWLWRLGRWIPAVDRNLNPRVAAERMKTLTLDGTRLAEAASLTYYNTIDVISRTSPEYPYQEA